MNNTILTLTSGRRPAKIVLKKLLAACLVLLVVCAGPAIAALLHGTSASETINGTNGADTIDATQGGADVVKGGKGNDTIRTDDGKADDTVDCGDPTSPTRGDQATVDEGDLTTNCDGNVTRVPLPPPDGAPADCDVITTAGQNLVNVANSHAAGTKFCIGDGEYTVSQSIPVQSRDHWYGVYTDGTRPNISTDTASNVMTADSSDGATIENVHIAGGQYTRGTVKSGRGISEGQNLTVKNIKASYNENQGIGGTASNLRVYDSVFDHNGNADSSYLAGSQTSSAGIKSVNSTFIYNSRFEDNFWNGAWCDLECGQFEIHDSVFLRNGKAGFHYEVSSGPAIFEGNTVQDNGYLAEANRHVGLLVVSSRNLQAYGNTFGGNRDWGAQFIEDSRDPVTGNINFYNNTMNGDPIQRCGQNGVTCSNNTAN